MNDIDRKIQEALRQSGGGEAFVPEPNVAEEVLASFRGRHRWLHLGAAALTFVLFGVAVWAGFRFYAAAEIREQLLWGGLTCWCGLSVGLLKLWFWLEMHTNRVLREVKRVELLLVAERRTRAG